MKTQRKPDAGNLHVWFDEEQQENLLLTLLNFMVCNNLADTLTSPCSPVVQVERTACPLVAPSPHFYDSDNVRL
jgi:hypothetical protein